MGKFLFVKQPEIFKNLRLGNVATVKQIVTQIRTENFADMVAFFNEDKKLVFVDWISLVRFGAKEHPDRMDNYLAMLNLLIKKVGLARVLSKYKNPEYHLNSRIGRDVMSGETVLDPGENKQELVPTVEQIDNYMKDLEKKVFCEEQVSTTDKENMFDKTPAVSTETPHETNCFTWDRVLFRSLWTFSFLTKVRGIRKIAQKLCPNAQPCGKVAKKSGENEG